eukprot:4687754-Prymnesium_polylepis.1
MNDMIKQDETRRMLSLDTTQVPTTPSASSSNEVAETRRVLRLGLPSTSSSSLDEAAETRTRKLRSACTAAVDF